MLSFIQLSNHTILYGDVIIRKESDRAICFYGIHSNNPNEPAFTLMDEDDEIWFGLTSAAIHLQKSQSSE